VETVVDINDAHIEGLRRFIEATVTAVATGRPRLGRG
jgi:hypothetical protein